MPRIPCTVLCIGALCTGCLNHRSDDGPEQGDDRFAQYIAGVSLITNKSRLSESERSERFRQLGEITGLSPDSALTVLGSLRDNPEKGKALSVRMNRLYEPPTDTATK